MCSRLGLTSLAYLWHQPQADLLQDMIQAGIHAILVKVAAMGLSPHKHLGRTLAEILPVMHRLNRCFELPRACAYRIRRQSSADWTASTSIEL